MSWKMSWKILARILLRSCKMSTIYNPGIRRNRKKLCRRLLTTDSKQLQQSARLKFSWKMNIALLEVYTYISVTAVDTFKDRALKKQSKKEIGTKFRLDDFGVLKTARPLDSEAMKQLAKNIRCSPRLWRCSENSEHLLRRASDDWNERKWLVCSGHPCQHLRFLRLLNQMALGRSPS